MDSGLIAIADADKKFFKIFEFELFRNIKKLRGIEIITCVKIGNL